MSQETNLQVGSKRSKNPESGAGISGRKPETRYTFGTNYYWACEKVLMFE